MHGLVRGVRFDAVAAVTGCVGMVNVSGIWLSRGLSNRLFQTVDSNVDGVCAAL